MLSSQRPTIHYTEFGELITDDELFHEWHTYLREMPRWLAEGKAGKFVLIKGSEIIGYYESIEAACEVASRRFLLQPALIHQIREREPILFQSAVFHESRKLGPIYRTRAE